MLIPTSGKIILTREVGSYLENVNIAFIWDLELDLNFQGFCQVPSLLYSRGLVSWEKKAIIQKHCIVKSGADYSFNQDLKIT